MPDGPVPTLPTETLLDLYRGMVRVRRFDQRVVELFRAGEIRGTAHSYVGQEAIAVAACARLGPGDFVVSHHRGHGHCLAKGASMDRIMAELYGRESGYCRGLGGSMHVADLALNILGANGIVGAGIGIGTGAALAQALRGQQGCGIVFFGDGAAAEGLFHEALNLASLWKLPVVFLCENNQYGLSTRLADVSAIDRIARRAAAYAMPGETVDGNDALAMHEAVDRAVARARAGEGPMLIEALTYRWGDHSMRQLPPYRSEAELAEWQARDPIPRLEAAIGRRNAAAPATLEAIRAEVEAELEAAVAFARAGAEPAPALMAPAVLAPLKPAEEPGPEAAHGREISMTEAINEALHEAMAEDARVLAFGEDVARLGGIFGCTRGLLERFGPARVRDTPIAEGVIGGLAVGAALSGFRPVAEVQLFDFVTLMMDMIVNQAAKFRFMLGGVASVPLVFRGPQGGGIRLAAQHSQSLEAWFAHVPGLVVVAPSTPYDAKGLLMSAIRDDNPVVFLEHKLLYVESKGPVPDGAYAIPLGRADIKRAGSDVTIVALQAMVPRALAAARQLAQEGISAEVIDPRTLRPLDTETILASVRRTNRVVIAHEAWTTGGIGAEIAATIVERAFDFLDAPPVRVGGADVPMPYNDTLERLVMPSAASIAEAVRRVCYR